MKVEFDKISDESRIWIYQSNDDFTEFDVDVINKKSDLFVSNWMAHNKDLEASFKILNNLKSVADATSSVSLDTHPAAETKHSNVQDL